ncbi:MAG TPA: methyltransferase [Chloroflexi bacterium]|nr:methyltransferase [Chloroflexota bacterium]HAF19219.1 methyltransferase [Chloroflexota bacterium]
MPLSGDLDFALRIVVTLILAIAIGTEREYHGHPAGIRTMALVGVGACLFTTISLESFFGSRTDPTRIAAQIVTGVGFLGAGAILRHGTDVRGLTTAATIWVVAAIGMVVGFGNYKIGIFTTALVLVTLVAIRPLERRMFHRQEGRHTEEDHFS